MLPDSSMPDEIAQALRRGGTICAASLVRPRIATDTKKHWDALVERWRRPPVFRTASNEFRAITARNKNSARGGGSRVE